MVFGAYQPARPNFTLTFLRSRKQTPHFASFIVPLWFNKLDIRDYLFHVYNVRILSVRSYVKLSPVTSGDPSSPRPAYNRWRRPISQKRMTVELEQPFVWPEEPQDLGAWNQQQHMESERESREYGETIGPTRDTYVDKTRRERMREQAKALLEGREQWRPSQEFGSGASLTRR